MSYRVHLLRAGVLASSRSFARREEAERAFTETVDFAQRRANHLKVQFSVELVRQGVPLQRRDVQPARTET